MKPNENIANKFSLFQDIQQAPIAPGQKFTKFDIVSKILNYLIDEWERKVVATEEGNNLSRFKVKESISSNLVSYEINL